MGGHRICGCHAQSGEVRENLLRGGGRDRRLQGAAGEAELGQLDGVRACLGDQVRAGDPDMDDAVLDVLGDVVRTDQQEVDRRVLTRYVESAFPELEAQARRVEQV